MYRTLVEALPLATYVALPDDRRSTRYVSPGIEVLLGHPASEFSADPERFGALLHPEDRQRVLAEIASAREPGRVFRCEYRLLASDGRAVWVRDEAAAGPDEDGVLVLRGCLVDVTEQRLADELLEAAEGRLRLLTEQLPAVLWTTDRELELTSLTGRGLRGPELEAGDFPGAAAGPALRRALAGDAASFEMEWGDRSFEAHVEPLRDELGETVGVIGVALDVTQRVRAGAKLREREEQLQQAQRLEALGRLAGGIAHDFNNLLTTISGNAHLLLASIPASDPKREEAESIRRTAERAAALVDQLLTFARRKVLQADEIDLNGYLRELEEFLRRLVPSSIRLVFSLEPRLAHVRIDPSQLEQVIVNLVVNARDAMPEGGTLLIQTGSEDALPGATPGADDGRRYVVLAVSDTGVGIDAETQARIFEPFFTTKEKRGGTGLGLATVHGIVGQCGGRILVESERGRGSTFRVCLPALEGAPQAASAATEGRAERSPVILVVEDDDGVRELACKTLGRRGYAVLEARDGREAIELWAQTGGDVDALVTDLVMPRMDGRTLAARLLKLRPSLRVLLVSGYADEDLPDRGLLEGEPLLRKPYTPDELARRLAGLLGSPPGASHEPAAPVG